MKLQELNEQELKETNGGLLSLNIGATQNSIDVDASVDLGSVNNLLGGLLGSGSGLLGGLLGTVNGLLGGLLGRL